MASDLYQNGLQKLADQTFNVETGGSIVLILVSDSYSFDETEDNLDTGGAADIESHEIDCDGYTQGFGSGDRKTPSSRTWRRDDPSSRIEFDFDDVTYSSLGGGVSANNDTLGGVVIAWENTNDSDSVPIAFDDLADNRQTNGSDITYSPDSEGMFQLRN
jgi:hypothetical protein